MMNRHKALLQAVVEWGVPTHKLGVGGGYVRDLVHQRQYKDMDVAIVGDYEHLPLDNLESLLKEAGWQLKEVYYQDSVGYSDESGDFNERLNAVIKVMSPCGRALSQHNVLEADLLFATSNFDDVRDFVRMNDFNINQFFLSYKAAMLDLQPEYLADPGLRGKLVQTRNTRVNASRIEKMIDVAKDCGWEVAAFEHYWLENQE